jgi:DNA-binding transcriptional LysR family regulator
MAAPRITLEQWRTLLAVVDAGGYARAAKVLHKSQSSVTYAVQQLESQLGVKAFKIEGRKARLTPTGDLLYRRAHYLLDEAAVLEQSAKRLSAGWEAEIRVAVEVIFPTWLLLECLDRLSKESPHTRIELIESVLGHRTDALAQGLADLAIFGNVPPGFLGEPLMHLRFVLAAHPDHTLHRLKRKLTMRDLRVHRHLVVRESSPERASAASMETAQRWTVSHLATSIEAARSGYGFAWLPEERIREELEAGTLKPLVLREGGERYADLYLIFADREHAGPATLRLAEIIREAVASECKRSGVAVQTPGRRRKSGSTPVTATKSPLRTSL